jgi:hypothetical protein
VVYRAPRKHWGPRINLHPQQWEAGSTALYTHYAISAGHIMCGSDIYYQTVEGTNTAQPLTPANTPEFLDAATGADMDTCYTDASAAPHDL